MIAFVLGGTHSGCGKTTASMALISALKARGLVVQPFKVGPDYLDPAYHSAVAGLPSINLDAWLLPRGFLRSSFRRRAIKADACVVEGMMGLFDGASGQSEIGSSAQAAKILGLPVILLMDASALARSAAAVVQGFSMLDPDLKIAGVIFNKVSGPGHYDFLRQAVQSLTTVPVLGYLPHLPDLKIPERHLGLVSVYERALPENFSERWAQAVSETVDLPELIKIAAYDPCAAKLEEAEDAFTRPSPEGNFRIAVARDEAFCFYYEDNLELLRAAGAELVFFSPIRDEALPFKVDALYFGGGFPELFARELSGNLFLKNQIRRAAAMGMPVYGECGGLMFLADSLRDPDGNIHEMSGVIPGRVIMTKEIQGFGYKQVRAVKDSILACAGESLKGHEFHWSKMPPPESCDAAYEDSSGRYGFAHENVLASYLHLHFGSNPKWLSRLLGACRDFRSGTGKQSALSI